MKIWMLIISTALLFSCSFNRTDEFTIFIPEINVNDKSQVHLHTYGFKQLSAVKYAEAIRNKGFRVRLRQNGYPGSKKENFIIFNLAESHRSDVQSVQEVLLEAGVKVDKIYFADYGKHEYTEGNIGVYLF
jgi:hypothetical protein